MKDDVFDTVPLSRCETYSVSTIRIRVISKENNTHFHVLFSGVLKKLAFKVTFVTAMTMQIYKGSHLNVAEG
jgi:hypothetical protein